MMKVNVGGVELPCRPTMGAMLRFKRETGREASDLDGTLSDMVTWLWCCVSSACAADGIEFGYTLQDFADRVDTRELTSFMEGQSPKSAADDGEKKSE